MTSLSHCSRSPRYFNIIDNSWIFAHCWQETAQLEAKAYELQQKTTVASRAKAVLDSWVRYEAQVKNRQQKELAETVINKIDKELENPRVLKQILDQSVAEIESKFVHYLTLYR